MRGRTEPASTVAPSTGVAGGDWWHCVHSWSPARPSCTFSLSEKSKAEPCATWQLVHVTAPALKQPESVSACGRLKRLGRPSGQNSPCASNSGNGSLTRYGSAWSS